MARDPDKRGPDKQGLTIPTCAFSAVQGQIRIEYSEDLKAFDSNFCSSPNIANEWAKFEQLT